MDEDEEFKFFIDRAIRDPVAAILLKYSGLTNIQYETLIIDILSDKISDKIITYDEKALFRANNVSRGSFSRTLAQARRNVVSAIYTILLLSYIGVFEQAPFDSYHLLAEKLQDYLKIFSESNPSQGRKLLQQIERELIEGINELSKPRSLKPL
jgi:hypothetical protein